MGCDACELLVINGVTCHETGCPRTNADRECRECGDTLERHEVCTCERDTDEYYDGPYESEIIDGEPC